MLDLTTQTQVKKNLYSFLLIGISKEITKESLLSYLSNIVHVVGISFLDSESVEVVVMRLSDCKMLIQSPLYIKGCKIQAVPYLYLGKKVNHTMSLSAGNTLTFEYCSRTILLPQLMEYVQRYCISKNSFKIIGPTKIAGNQGLATISLQFTTSQEIDYVVKSTGYSGHAYDLPISWLLFDAGY